MTLKLCFLGLVCAFTLVLLKNLGWRGAPVFSAVLFAALLSDIPLFLKDAVKIFGDWDVGAESVAAIFKIIGIGYLFGVSSEICRELGEGGIATALSLVGRFEIIAVALPFISEIFSLAVSLVS